MKDDIIGKTFNLLNVLKRIEDKISPCGTKRKQYLCRCSCGKEIIVCGSHLKNNHTKSCGCYKKEESSKRLLKNLTGINFGKLTVLKRADDSTNISGRKNVVWLCVCECGEEKLVSSNNLIQRNVQSCGCLSRESDSTLLDNLLNKTFGKLTVLKRSNDRIYSNGARHTCWLCRCECGNKTIVLAKNLKNGKTKSCGCFSESWVVLELKKYFKENYNGKAEYKILRNPETKYYLPYDIYLPNENVFIEVHGEQHYRFIKYFHKTIEKFEYNKKLDKMKKNFARKNGVYIEVDLRKIKTVERAIEYILNLF